METFAVNDSMALWSLVIVLALLALNALLNLGEAALSGLRASRLRAPRGKRTSMRVWIIAATLIACGPPTRDLGVEARL